MTKKETNIILNMCREAASNYYWAMDDTKIRNRLKGKYVQAMTMAIALGVEMPEDIQDLEIDIQRKQLLLEIKF